MPELIMLVGLPGTGKSTWVKDQGYHDKTDWMVLSTDSFIESVATKEGKTYSEAFPSTIRFAEANLTERLNYAIRNRMNIVWDQTNLSSDTRSRKLARVPLCYRRIARVFPIPENHQEWLSSKERTYKVIPSHIIDSMIATYVTPSIYEGFDEIITPIYGKDL